MIDRDAFRWFKETFHRDIQAAIAGTPFSLDLLAAIAAQETGYIWARLRHEFSVPELLELCVGDTLDADGGRRAFPRTKSDLIAWPRGEEMFRIARDALVQMAAHVPGYAAVARRPNKFCHGFGIFQYDLQFFKVDPDYFLERRWRSFAASLEKCLKELHEAMRRAGLRGRATLSELEQVHVAIAYNTGTFRASRGLKQGHFDGTRFYGEQILDYLRMSQTVSTPSVTSPLPPPLAGTAALAPATPVAETGRTFEVDVQTAPLRLRREPRIDRDRPSRNVIAHLPDGHLVRLVSERTHGQFLEVETHLDGAHLRGFAAKEFLKEVGRDRPIPAVQPEASPPTAGVVEVFAPRKTHFVTKRTAAASAHSLNEPNQPRRTGSDPQSLRESLWEIIENLAVDKASHLRYQPRGGLTFCNIYAHDYCHLANVYLPRVWWTPDAIERLGRGEVVEPRLGSTIDEQRANDLFRWLNAFGPRFGWRRSDSLTKLQTEANLGAVAVIVARRKIEGRSGHIALVVPETEHHRARRDASGEVIAPLQSQAGTRNFRFGTGTANWWNGEQFADSAFWLHA